MKKNLKYYLQSVLTKSELAIVPTSHDVVGDIMILNEFPEQLHKKEKKIGQTILDNYHNINVVCKKTGNYAGTFRTPVLRILAGERRKETIHREAGVNLKLHVENVYFSERTGGERLRIAKQVKKGEDVLVMFSGSGILPLVLAKNSGAKSIVGVEINPIAHKYAEYNNEKNKTIDNIQFVNGDVRKEVPKLKKTFDRICMPLPKNAEEYLDVALSVAKKGSVIHVYQFMGDEQEDQVQKIKNIAKEMKKKIRILAIVPCGSYAPGVSRVSVDVKVLS